MNVSKEKVRLSKVHYYASKPFETNIAINTTTRISKCGEPFKVIFVCLSKRGTQGLRKSISKVLLTIALKSERLKCVTLSSCVL